MINGANQATFYVLPFYGKHPDEYPRFRDCFVGELHNTKERNAYGLPVRETRGIDVISIYLRIGRGNRPDYVKEIEELRSHPLYVKDYDDDFDNTFAIFTFKVPEEWQGDYKLILSGKIQETSPRYYDQLIKIYPKLEDRFKILFKKDEQEN